MITTDPKNYRHDIDGLRAFAILSVLAFHFFKASFPKGFLGVDIFFVISGFVVTASLFQYTNKTFSEAVAEFYSRRIRRLLPALIVCIVLSSVLFRLLHSTDTRSLRIGVSALFGVSNFYIPYLGLDYFSDFSTRNLFTHTWSLGSEEQFYLFFPFLFFGLGYYRLKSSEFKLRLLIGCTVLSAVSFVVFCFLLNYVNRFAYYVSPSRMWQLAIGAACYILIPRFSKLPKSIHFFTALIALAALPAVHLYESYNTPLDNLIVTISAALLLLTVPQFKNLNNLFSIRPLTYLGKLSYSLYLWHWPVIVLLRPVLGAPKWLVLVQFLISFTLAAASYHLIERPLKKITVDMKPLKIFISAAVAVASAVAILWTLRDDRFGKSLYLGQNPFDFSLSKFEPPVAMQVCDSADSFNSDQFPPSCSFGVKTADNPTRNLFLLGDSTAIALKNALSLMHIHHQFGIMMFAKNSAVPTNSMIRTTGKNILLEGDRWPKDQKLYQKLFDYIETYGKSGDLVVVSAEIFMNFCSLQGSQECRDSWRDDLAAGWQNLDNTKVTREESFSYFVRDLARLQQRLSTKNIRVILIAPLPYWTHLHAVFCDNQNFKLFGIDDSCLHPKLSQQQFLRQPFMDELQKYKVNNEITVFDPISTFCEGEYCRYADERTNRNYFIDNTHLSTAGNLKFYESFSRFLVDNKLMPHSGE